MLHCQQASMWGCGCVVAGSWGSGECSFSVEVTQPRSLLIEGLYRHLVARGKPNMKQSGWPVDFLVTVRKRRLFLWSLAIPAECWALHTQPETAGGVMGYATDSEW